MTDHREQPISFGAVYEDALIRRSHELVALGHMRLVPSDLAGLEETDITGKLCDAMNEVLDGANAPSWAIMLTVVDDQPESVRDKTGKRRPRTDVCVRCINPRPEHRFRFEAKRLNQKAALSIYLGDDGLLALVHNYYGDLPYAGMIGYVQTGTPSEWSQRIKEALLTAPRSYEVIEPVTFLLLGIGVPEPVFCSTHGTSIATGKRITHTLLLSS
jgi:hypothetical protein